MCIYKYTFVIKNIFEKIQFINFRKKSINFFVINNYNTKI